ncbi:hypothetical protein [Pusillimonas sp.]|uniref:hypothetical protein n=1 Tax=Pusillimonas sp. TaxID=3040095 RepID=UPI0029B8BB61|nr:hypothetical protein [Pusillimonas sp.]MDX3894084.1 hypothetical protein [Pusillimonas sp.]
MSDTRGRTSEIHADMSSSEQVVSGFRKGFDRFADDFQRMDAVGRVRLGVDYNRFDEQFAARPVKHVTAGACRRPQAGRSNWAGFPALLRRSRRGPNH